MYKNNKILGIIPARGGSKGIPRKNIIDLGGKPLIAWTIEEAIKSNYLDRLIVSTDDDEIKSISLKYGADVPFLRDKQFARDDTSTIDTVLNVLLKLEDEYDYVVLLQPTSPFRTVKDIDLAIEKIINNSNFESLISIKELDIPIEWIREIDETGRLKKVIKYNDVKKYQRQNFEKQYLLNGAIYISKIKTLLEEKKFETDNTLSFMMSKFNSMDIDTLDDLELAKFMIRKIIETN